MEWSAIFFQRPLPGLVGISNSNFKRKKVTKLLCFRYHCSLNIWFLHYIVKPRYAFGTLSGIHFTPHDVVKPSCTNRINIVCQTTTSYMLCERFGYNHVVFVCPPCDHRHASQFYFYSYMLRLKIGLFYQIRDENQAKFKISYSCSHRVPKSARYDACININNINPEYKFLSVTHNSQATSQWLADIIGVLFTTFAALLKVICYLSRTAYHV